MLIKKHKNKNQYLVQNGIYVRDFSAYGIPAIDVNQFLHDTDYELCMENELSNIVLKHPTIDTEPIIHPNVIIVSDGYQFSEKQKLLASIPKDITIIAVNGALKNWTMVGEKSELKRAINYYVINNPYEESLNFLPRNHRYYPKCIASVRTNAKFIDSYLGAKFLYAPAQNINYSGTGLKADYYIDDYRNPICAALGLAYRFRANKILLFCCDDSFADERPGAEQLENGLYCYPQQIVSKNIIDANCFWLKKQKISVANCSNGGNYVNASYINSEVNEILEYFK